MRILRLTNSNDFAGEMPDSDRSYRAVEAALETEFGEPVETVRRTIWPSPDLPGIVERWIEEYEPDIVFLKMSGFWYMYESVPLRIKRRFGRVGSAVGEAGLKAGRNKQVAESRVLRKLRHWAQATIGGDTHFTIDYVLKNMEDVMRRVLRHEDVLLVVRGSRGGRERPELPKKAAARLDARRQEFRQRLGELCAAMNVPLIAGSQKRKYDPAKYQADMLHANAAGQADQGAFEAAALVEIWRKHHGAYAAAPASGKPVSPEVV